KLRQKSLTVYRRRHRSTCKPQGKRTQQASVAEGRCRDMSESEAWLSGRRMGDVSHGPKRKGAWGVIYCGRCCTSLGVAHCKNRIRSSASAWKLHGTESQ